MNVENIKAALSIASGDEKVLFLSRIIRELTFQARFHSTEPKATVRQILLDVEYINKIIGYQIAIAERIDMEEELFMDMVFETVSNNDTGGMRQLLIDFIGKQRGPVGV